MDAQQTVETVETAVQAVDDIQTIFRNNPVVLIGVAAASAAVGAGVAVVVSNRYFKTKYEQIANDEVAEARIFFQNRFKGEFSDPTKLVDEEDPGIAVESEMIKQAVEILEDQSYVAYDKAKSSGAAVAPSRVRPGETTVQEVEVKASIGKNIWDTQNPTISDDYDLDDELEKRRRGEPYLVEKENFFENKADHSQTSLTYFEGDDVLVDESDQPIRNYEKVIGQDNLHFGRGSGDKNVVYIRNDKLSADYEIVRNERTYTQEVLGLNDPEEPKVKRFRNHDE